MIRGPITAPFFLRQHICLLCHHHRHWPTFHHIFIRSRQTTPMNRQHHLCFQLSSFLPTSVKSSASSFSLDELSPLSVSSSFSISSSSLSSGDPALSSSSPRLELLFSSSSSFSLSSGSLFLNQPTKVNVLAIEFSIPSTSLQLREPSTYDNGKSSGLLGAGSWVGGSSAPVIEK
jgi:hypothetical protein